MMNANTNRIKIQEELLNKIKNLNYKRALEVAGGRGHLTD